MVTAWLPHGYHMVTTWLPHGYHLVATWLPHGYHLVKQSFVRLTADTAVYTHHNTNSTLQGALLGPLHSSLVARPSAFSAIGR